VANVRREVSPCDQCAPTDPSGNRAPEPDVDALGQRLQDDAQGLEECDARGAGHD